jgi:hypothetical protein
MVKLPLYVQNGAQLTQACESVGYVTSIPWYMEWGWLLVAFLLVVNIIVIILCYRKKMRKAIKDMQGRDKDQKKITDNYVEVKDPHVENDKITEQIFGGKPE